METPPPPPPFPAPPPVLPPPASNTLGKAGLVLGVIASFFVVNVGLCAGVGKEQGWLPHVGPLLFVVGGSFAFLGLLAALFGLTGLFGRRRSKATAAVGLLLGLFTVGLFLAIVQAAGR